MIGDIVAYNGCVCRIYSIHGKEPRNNRFDCKEYVTLQCDGLIDVGVDEVQPIELNDKILEKNGFNRVDGGFYGIYYEFSINRHESIYMKRLSDGKWYVKTKYDYLSLSWFTEYVHGLQHAFIQIGHDNIADNIKI